MTGCAQSLVLISPRDEFFVRASWPTEDVPAPRGDWHHIIVPSCTGQAAREHIEERGIDYWIITIHKNEHWQVKMNDAGQAGWIVKTLLSLPRKLSKCTQDVDILDGANDKNGFKKLVSQGIQS